MALLKTLNFIPQTKICSHCLKLFNEPNSKNKTKETLVEICVDCRASLDINIQKRKKLWAKQLKLFLNYKSKTCFKGNPDVLVMYSGGTDSTLALYLAKEELNLNVVALKFNMSWERSEIDKKAEEFCLKYHIPLITIRIDLKSMFLRRYRNVNNVSDESIIKYPWCRLCAEGRESFVWWGAEQVAGLLKIIRVITGNNIAFFSKSAPRRENPRSEVEHFRNKYNQWLYPTSILEVTSLKCIIINLPIALGYNKKKKMNKLSEIGYSLPSYYFRTTETDCNLGLVFPCAKKLLDSGQEFPKASAYFEFMSGYLTREEWLESLIRANSFSKEDSKAGMKFMRNALAEHTPNNEITINFNRNFLEKFKQFDAQNFKDMLIERIRVREYIIHAQYFLELKKIKYANNEATKALEFAPKEIDAYLSLGSLYRQTKRNDNALKVYKKALEIFPNEGAVYLGLAKTYFTLKCYDEAIKAANKVVELDYKEDNIYFLLGVCYKKIKQYKKAIEKLKRAEKISPEEHRVNFSLSRCYRNISQIEQADRELEKGYFKLKKFKQTFTS